MSSGGFIKSITVIRYRAPIESPVIQTMLILTLDPEYIFEKQVILGETTALQQPFWNPYFMFSTKYITKIKYDQLLKVFSS